MLSRFCNGVVIFSLLHILTAALGITARPSPLIILGGMGGCGLEATVGPNADVPYFWCRSAKPFRVWVSLREILPDEISCYLEDMSPMLNVTDGLLYDPSDITISAIQGVSSIEYLDGKREKIPYMHDLLDILRTRGYKDGANLHAAPYDWRLAPRDLAARGFFNNTQRRIERIYADNGQQKVSIVTHSYGGPIALAFLQAMSQTWLDRFIHAYVPISAPFGGVSLDIQTQTSGTKIFPYTSAHYLRNIMITSSSFLWMLPRAYADVFDVSAMLVKTPDRVYTVNDVPQMLDDLGLKQARALYDIAGTEPTLNVFAPPLVDTYVLFGDGIPTQHGFEYSEAFRRGVAPSTATDYVYTNGDGTVTAASLRRAIAWKDAQHNAGKVLQLHAFANITHISILTDPAVLGVMLSAINCNLDLVGTLATVEE